MLYEVITHYLSKGKVPRIELYSAASLPRWLSRIDVKAQFEWHGTRRLWPGSMMADHKFVITSYSIHYTKLYEAS